MASIIRNSAKQAPSNLVRYSSNTTTIHRLVKETLSPGLNTIRRVSLQEHENSKFQKFNQTSINYLNYSFKKLK